MITISKGLFLSPIADEMLELMRELCQWLMTFGSVVCYVDESSWVVIIVI